MFYTTLRLISFTFDIHLYTIQLQLTKKDNSSQICLPLTVVENSAVCGCELSIIQFLSANFRQKNKLNNIILKNIEFMYFVGIVTFTFKFLRIHKNCETVLLPKIIILLTISRIMFLPMFLSSKYKFCKELIS